MVQRRVQGDYILFLLYIRKSTKTCTIEPANCGVKETKPRENI